jgi:hypothetical protein
MAGRLQGTTDPPTAEELRRCADLYERLAAVALNRQCADELKRLARRYAAVADARPD